ncbi:rhombosortase [Alishewanella sp. HH-ZS]|uniref:rhombosortase n=1 Tax=Alishewanella sp. HH-ZS TaxID=1856684 RepID=UPI0008235B1F|nr:rhombosortase [Alishewanella sp. HH-ZS]OCW97492.1 rhombosortase [Alishewanella sp. HH-ZS]
MPILKLKSDLPYLLLASCCVLLFLLPPAWQHALEYNQTMIWRGELWRLLSGQLLHSNVYHLLMNLAGLAVLMILHGRLPGRLAVGWQLLLLLLATALALLLLAPEIDIYVGLSGMLHGLLCYGAVADLRQGYRSGMLILIGVSAKLALEQWQGPDPVLGAQIGAEVAIDAHLLGALCGVLLALLSWRQIKHQ